MVIEEFFKYRNELLDQSKDDEGFIQESLLLSQVLPSMLDAKLIDTEDFNNAYLKNNAEKIKVNAYCVNESGERLQLFIIDEQSYDLTVKADELRVSRKAYFENQFKRCSSFLSKARKGHLNDFIQDSSPAQPLITQISCKEGAEQFDVIEIFLISTVATVSAQGATIQPKRIGFDDEELKISYTKGREKRNKTWLIKKRLIDLNFLYNVIISQGNREALVVDFEKMFDTTLHAIKAADETNFESYLCVLPATMIARLYKYFSTRLLEKNVRSFLQFKGVNKGIRETIRTAPEKFVAYNNGLTITATKAKVSQAADHIKIQSLTDFQIVNGGQTTATIYFTHKDGFDISNVKVMAKINVAKKTTDEELDELISNISTFSNAQSRVSKVDLRSRNPQLVRIKSLSESVLTPSGQKWFFERAKGEFNTKMRIAGNNKSRLQKEYPTERRFSKELMAKYYCAWGDQPHMVKKGGEKIFRFFIEKLTGEGAFKKPLMVNRDFFEELIAKIILFRSLEKIYGAGKKSMGQLRSAVVPYTISVLHNMMDGTKNEKSFDLLKIWVNERLESDLEDYLTSLLMLVNDLIKKYSQSDDYGEYSKKEELWKAIKQCPEIKDFVSDPSSLHIVEKYGIDKAELKKRKGKSLKQTVVNFNLIQANVQVFSNGVNYYKSMQKQKDFIDETDDRYLSKIVSSIQNKVDLNEKDLNFEKKITNHFRVKYPEFFDKTDSQDITLRNSMDFIVKKYNSAIDGGSSVISEFDKIAELCNVKNIKYGTVFREIGKLLSDGDTPTIKQVIYASNAEGSLF